MMTGHQCGGETTRIPGSVVGMGLNQDGAGLNAEKVGLTTEDVIYKIATVTAVISLLATVL